MKKLLFFAVALLSATIFNSQTFTSSTSVLNNEYHSGGCVGVADMDMDGYDDIIILDDSRNLYLEYQNADGTFTSTYIGEMSGQSQWGMAVGDMDNDGHCDVFSGGNFDGFHIANIDDADNHNITTNNEYGVFMQGLTAGDFNNDGWLDAFGCHDVGESGIWGNDGAGNLTIQNDWIDMATTPSSDNSGNYGSVYSDVDNDGDLDIYIAKCRQGVTDPNDPRRINALFINDGNNNYSDEAMARGLAPLKQSWTSDFMDIDNDGDFDCFLTNHDYSLMVLENDGNGYFTDITQTSGLQNEQGFFLQGKFEDFDNDGFVDLLFAGGVSGFYHNNGDKTFSPIANDFSDEDVLHSFGIGDLNHDGFSDFYASYGNGYVSSDDNHDDKVWYNDGNNNNWITFQLEGVISNTSAIGAKISIYGDWGVQIREVRAGESYGITNSFNAHFGLGTSTSIDYVTINWPAGGMTLIENSGINQFIEVIEQEECDTNLAVIIDNSGSFTLCPGVDDLAITATASTENIIWSNGTTENPINIDESGTYYAIAWDDNGCAISSESVLVEVYNPETPMIESEGSLIMCNGASVEVFVVDPIDGATYTWSDGTEASSITVTETGIYNVELLDFCENTSFSSAVEVSVVSVDAPIVDDQPLIPGNSVTFESDNANTLWYATDSALDPLFDGQNYTTGTLNSGTSFWAQAYDNSLMSEANGGKISNETTGDYHENAANWLTFDAMENIIITSVKVYAEDSGNRTIIIENSGGVEIFNETFMMPQGESVVEINASVPAGENYAIKTTGDPGLWRDEHLGSNLPYPYLIGDLASITGTNINSNNWDNYYYYFYDWNVQTEADVCYSELVEVYTGTDISIEENNIENQLNIYPNPVSDLLNIKFNYSSNEKVVINIYDQLGKMIISETVNSNNFQLDVSDLASGLYSFNLNVNETTISRKLIVE